MFNIFAKNSFEKATWLHLSGKTDKAEKQYNRVIERFPNSKYAAWAKAELDKLGIGGAAETVSYDQPVSDSKDASLSKATCGSEIDRNSIADNADHENILDKPEISDFDNNGLCKTCAKGGDLQNLISGDKQKTDTKKQKKVPMDAGTAGFWASCASIVSIAVTVGIFDAGKEVPYIVAVLTWLIVYHAL